MPEQITATQTNKDGSIVNQGAVHEQEAAAAPDTQPEPEERGPLVREPGEGAFSFDGTNFSVYGKDGSISPYVGEFVDFVSRDPGLMVEMGDVVVRFQLGRATIPLPLAQRLEKHMLYSNGKIFRADEVAIVGGEIVSYRENATFKENMEASSRGDVVMYATKANPNLQIHFGDFDVKFTDGYAAVDKAKVERVERHVFFREGRITRL